MKTVKPFRLSTLTRPYRWQRRDHLGVAVMAFCSLGDDPRLMPEQAMWRTVADEIGPGAVLDLGTPKLTPEFLVSGFGYTHHQPDKTACAVRVRVGGIDKKLTVVGDRFWLNNRPTPAQPFEKIPVDWCHTYGGPGVPENPLGIGTVDETVNGVRTRRLPHVEAPGSQMSSPRQASAPAGFGAIPSDWPQRMSLMGTKYDQEWLENDFPGFARDIDWRYFNAAPSDQRWEGHQELPTGASYEIWNMHPDVPVLRGHLPAWRPRCFVSPHKHGAELRETELRLTTAWFFPHRDRVALIWHGVFPIMEDDAADVQILMAALELPDAPKPLGHYEEVMRRRLDSERGAIQTLRDSDLVPREVMGEWDRSLMPDVLSEPMARNMRAGQQRDYELRRAELLARGQDPDKLLSPPVGLEEPPDMDDLPDYLERMEADARRTQEEMGPLADWAAAASVPRFDPEPPATPEAEDDPLPGEAPPPDANDETDGMAALLRQSQLYSAHLSAPALPMPSARSGKWRRRLAAVEPGKRNFSGLNLAGVDLSGMALQGADFSGANLEDANLAEANLDDCDFSQSVMARAQLTRTSLARANLRQANLGGARCEQTVLSGAVLHETNCQKTHFESCNFAGATFEQTQFNEAVLKGCNFGKSRWRQMALIRMTLEDLLFDEADFDQMTWIECRLRRVSFVSCRLLRCGFVTTDCSDGIDFSGASLEGSSFAHGSSLAHALFRNALVKQCGLRTTSLAHADLSDARLDNSDFSECDMRFAKLERVAAGDSLFIRADFTGASFLDANLIDANLSKSDLRSANLGGANLYRADVSQAQVDAVTRMQDAYTQNAKVWPARRPEAPAA